ncbi:hypothetical protein OSU_2712 [Vibrio cholerae PS15]|nr:hypothetical protein OSU_2712 [Vibrio cholerae PS15]
MAFARPLLLLALQQEQDEEELQASLAYRVFGLILLGETP